LSRPDNPHSIQVIEPGNPRRYQPNDLPGWQIVAEVRRGAARGALVYNPSTDGYRMARAGALSSLDQREVRAALGIEPVEPGRPNEMESGGRRNIYLDALSIERAREAGDGNLSLGVRIALEQWSQIKGLPGDDT